MNQMRIPDLPPLPPRKITFLINSMEGGGAERAMANLIGHLLPHLPDCRVELILLDDLPRAQVLPEGVRVVTLDGGGSMLRSARALARYWLKGGAPDLCISFLARANCLNAWFAQATGHEAIISERVQTSAHLASARGAAVLRLITRLSYPRAAAVVPVSQGVALDLERNFGVKSARMTVIGNPIDAAHLQRLALQAPAIALPKRYLLAMGRLVPNKNFPMLLAAYAKANPKSDLVILGEGSERAALTKQIAALGLTGRVHLPGFVANPYPVIAGSDYLVSASNAEGFPNTLIEAMALGRAVVATDCPSGPAEVLGGDAPIGSGRAVRAAHGVLCPMNDSRAMAEALGWLEDIALRTTLAAQAQSRAQDFGVDAVVHRYLGLIHAACPRFAAASPDALIGKGD
ncbi:N-acetylgalactosamine-N,N'-diacetylbacillosaminyl-diphospho-undecaprenol 4-alpha-N-acetylgalactosaminyltransferase [Rhodobacter aestuarii]|uniref:N-acetylgalactosamine-N,N'-diacetylbacillosaminyl-diphospho-undecaprenol 4-alpha-N-acetylgalactosaminyltransferase n=1 Tax=Rhodobacter aestuarii TaxID=453582 RepID=A0A1N7MSY9_9RHOB|nr:glycosyltransferase [Rhodobacter aestuarii]PTV96556.1 N-acetylgalactosamine-N,N'-diacetylbacillosaminyl-diphospho-undecaprenol 4-alpha-N-acetylgalactosaminyltransferase [Rhodobacter aestuarii]SIS89216.1 N-acetylgalactosamine-N,N'-diacetylbacillosaminyl-diphospho-undecaprenol 4-alpha-N-acetylgalactosaminyltransferase [Rhodobacter aestuarii]